MMEMCGDAENRLASELMQHEMNIEKEILDPLNQLAEVYTVLYGLYKHVSPIVLLGSHWIFSCRKLSSENGIFSKKSKIHLTNALTGHFYVLYLFLLLAIALLWCHSNTGIKISLDFSIKCGYYIGLCFKNQCN